MEHRKAYHQIELNTANGLLHIEGPIGTETLEQYDFHPGLVAFRPPSEQKKALLKITSFPESRIIIAKDEQTVVGYICIQYPDPLERWAAEKVEQLLMLGAMEVAPAYRGVGVAKSLLKVAFMDDAMEDYLIITTEYYWHWDLKGSGLSIWEYRNLMERVMSSVGFKEVGTNDPEICSHPANALMARIGKYVSEETVAAFDRLRFGKSMR